MSRDADRRPDAGPPLDELRKLAERLPLDAIDELWLFPTRRAGSTDSTVLVLAAFDDDGDRRRILTAHFATRFDKRGRAATETTLTEHGSAPADRVGRLIEGVLRRLDEELAALPPRAARIGGEAGRWSAFVDALASVADADGSAEAPPAPER